MAQNTNIINSLNIVSFLIEKKNIDESVKSVFYYFSNLYLVKNGFSPQFPVTDFKSKNVKQEDALHVFVFSNGPSETKSILNDDDILNYFTRLDPKNTKYKANKFQEFVINFEKKTNEEKLDFVKKNVFENSCHLPRFMANMFYHDENEEIRNKVSKFVSKGITLEKYGDFKTLNNLYNVVGRDEFVQIVFHLSDEKNTFVNPENVMELKEVSTTSGFEVLATVFLAIKDGNTELAKNILLKFLDVNERCPLIVSEGIRGDVITSLYFIRKFIPEIVLYANLFENNIKEEILSKLIDSCMTAKLRTSAKEDNFIRESGLFEIVRNIVELETDPDNYGVEYKNL